MSKSKAGTGRVTPQKVRAVLRKEGMTPAIWIPAKDPHQIGSWAKGYTIRVQGGYLVVKHYFSRWPSETDRYWAHALIHSALAAAGITCDVWDGAVWVPVEKKPQ